MSARRQPHGAQQQLEIGRAVLEARALGTRWKALARTYDRTPRELQRYAAAVRGLRRFVSREAMSHFSPACRISVVAHAREAVTLMPTLLTAHQEASP